MNACFLIINAFFFLLNYSVIFGMEAFFNYQRSMQSAQQNVQMNQYGQQVAGFLLQSNPKSDLFLQGFKLMSSYPEDSSEYQQGLGILTGLARDQQPNSLAQFWLGKLALQKGDLEKAEMYLGCSSYPPAKVDLSKIYAEKGKNDEAVNELRKAAQPFIIPQYAYFLPACEQLGIALAKQPGKEHEALSKLDYALSLGSTNPDVFYEKGNLLYKQFFRLPESYPFFAAAAQTGHEEAQLSCAKMLWAGQGVKRDQEKAHTFLEYLIKNARSQEVRSAAEKFLNKSSVKFQEEDIITQFQKAYSRFTEEPRDSDEIKEFAFNTLTQAAFKYLIENENNNGEITLKKKLLEMYKELDAHCEVLALSISLLKDWENGTNVSYYEEPINYLKELAYQGDEDAARYLVHLVKIKKKIKVDEIIQEKALSDFFYQKLADEDEGPEFYALLNNYLISRQLSSEKKEIDKNELWQIIKNSDKAKEAQEDVRWHQVYAYYKLGEIPHAFIVLKDIKKNKKKEKAVNQDLADLLTEKLTEIAFQKSLQCGDIADQIMQEGIKNQEKAKNYFKKVKKSKKKDQDPELKQQEEEQKEHEDLTIEDHFSIIEQTKKVSDKKAADSYKSSLDMLKRHAENKSHHAYYLLFKHLAKSQPEEAIRYLKEVEDLNYDDDNDSNSIAKKLGIEQEIKNLAIKDEEKLYLLADYYKNHNRVDDARDTYLRLYKMSSNKKKKDTIALLWECTLGQGVRFNSERIMEIVKSCINYDMTKKRYSEAVDFILSIPIVGLSTEKIKELIDLVKEKSNDDCVLALGKRLIEGSGLMQKIEGVSVMQSLIKNKNEEALWYLFDQYMQNESTYELASELLLHLQDFKSFVDVKTTKKKVKGALSVLNEKAKENEKIAEDFIAIYGEGISQCIKPDREKALKFAEIAEKGKSAFASMYIARIALNQSGNILLNDAAENIKKACEYFGRAMTYSKDDPSETGGENYRKALEKLRELHERGNPCASCQLFMRLSDREKALHILEKCIKASIDSGKVGSSIYDILKEIKVNGISGYQYFNELSKTDPHVLFDKGVLYLERSLKCKTGESVAYKVEAEKHIRDSLEKGYVLGGSGETLATIQEELARYYLYQDDPEKAEQYVEQLLLKKRDYKLLGRFGKALTCYPDEQRRTKGIKILNDMALENPDVAIYFADMYGKEEDRSLLEKSGIEADYIKSLVLKNYEKRSLVELLYIRNFLNTLNNNYQSTEVDEIIKEKFEEQRKNDLGAYHYALGLSCYFRKMDKEAITLFDKAVSYEFILALGRRGLMRTLGIGLEKDKGFRELSLFHQKWGKNFDVDQDIMYRDGVKIMSNLCKSLDKVQLDETQLDKEKGTIGILNDLEKFEKTNDTNYLTNAITAFDDIMFYFLCGEYKKETNALKECFKKICDIADNGNIASAYSLAATFIEAANSKKELFNYPFNKLEYRRKAHKYLKYCQETCSNEEEYKKRITEAFSKNVSMLVECLLSSHVNNKSEIAKKESEILKIYDESLRIMPEEYKNNFIFDLADIYFNNKIGLSNVEEALDKGLQQLKTLANSGNKRALETLYCCYSEGRKFHKSGITIQKNNDFALKYLNQWVETKDPRAYIAKGEMLYAKSIETNNTKEIKKLMNEAKENFQKAADLKDVDGIVRSAKIEFELKNFENSWKLFNDSLIADNYTAHMYKSYMLFFGKGTEKSISKSKEYLLNSFNMLQLQGENPLLLGYILNQFGKDLVKELEDELENSLDLDIEKAFIAVKLVGFCNNHLHGGLGIALKGEDVAIVRKYIEKLQNIEKEKLQNIEELQNAEKEELQKQKKEAQRNYIKARASLAYLMLKTAPYFDGEKIKTIYSNFMPVINDRDSYENGNPLAEEIITFLLENLPKFAQIASEEKEKGFYKKICRLLKDQYKKLNKQKGT